MAENITFFGDVADGFDQRVAQTQHILDNYVEKSGYSVGSMILASTTMAFVQFGQSFVDTLRVGNGIAEGGWRGYGSDALRVLNIAGVSGAAWTRISKVLVVKQVEGCVQCVWISTANALRSTGQRFFITLEELAKSANVDLSAVVKAGGTSVSQVKSLVTALQRMRVPVSAVSPAGADLQALENVARANTNGVIAFGIEYGSAGRRFGHMIYATYSSVEGLVVTDTNGALYRGVKAFATAYPNASLVSETAFFIKNAAIVSAAKVSASAAGLANLVLELIPVQLKTPEKANLRNIVPRYRRI